MNRLKLRLVGATVVAASVVLAAAVCAQFGQAAIAAALSIYALGAGAWLYHAIERYVVAKRLNTVHTAAKPLLPVMAAIIGLTQAVIRALSDVAELQTRRDSSPWPPRYLAITRVYRRPKTDDDQR
jgi:tellurite resistance protein TehA-like permease